MKKKAKLKKKQQPKLNDKDAKTGDQKSKHEQELEKMANDVKEARGSGKDSREKQRLLKMKIEEGNNKGLTARKEIADKAHEQLKDSPDGRNTKVKVTEENPGEDKNAAKKDKKPKTDPKKTKKSQQNNRMQGRRTPAQQAQQNQQAQQQEEQRQVEESKKSDSENQARPEQGQTPMEGEPMQRVDQSQGMDNIQPAAMVNEVNDTKF